jgi:hypothetical protein
MILTVHLLQVGEVESGGQEHGALVQQILQTQQELQDGNRITKGGVQIVSIPTTVVLYLNGIYNFSFI